MKKEHQSTHENSSKTTEGGRERCDFAAGISFGFFYLGAGAGVVGEQLGEAAGVGAGGVHGGVHPIRARLQGLNTWAGRRNQHVSHRYGALLLPLVSQRQQHTSSSRKP